MRGSRLFTILNLMIIAFGIGCTNMKTTDTSRTAMEQMLVSNSIDQALEKVDFRPFSQQAVFLQDKYVDCVDKNYLVASIRHRAFSAGARLVDKEEDADIVLEVRTGSVGTDNAEMYVGIPGISLPVPVPVSLPEVQFYSRKSQTATAKIGLVAYDAKTKAPLGDGGVSLARSDDNNSFILGLGPYQNGSVRKEVNRSLKAGSKKYEIPNQVAFDSSPLRGGETGRIRLTSEADEGPASPYRPGGSR